jgi:hypothetical protein
VLTYYTCGVWWEKSTLVVLLEGVDDRLGFVVAETVVVFSHLLDVVAAQVVGFADRCRVVSKMLG